MITEILTVGIQGATGATGASGAAGPQNLFVQNAAPVTAPPTYLWIQTGLGAGTDMTFWVEDGLA